MTLQIQLVTGAANNNYAPGGPKQSFGGLMELISILMPAINNAAIEECSNRTTSIRRTQTGVIPKGTRDIEVVVEMTCDEGSWNDGYAGNLSLVITND